MIGQADRPGSGRELVLVDRRPEPVGPSYREPDGQVLEPVPVVYDDVITVTAFGSGGKVYEMANRGPPTSTSRHRA